jgi:hypothetical protein
VKSRLYQSTRDLHFYGGLFISPFVLLFAVSVFYLVHAKLPQATRKSVTTRTVADLPLPDDLEKASGLERIEALKPALKWAGVQGEVGWIQHRIRDNRFIIPVTVPGRITTVTIDAVKREAAIEERTTGLADAWITLHKSPGPHLAAIRMNWFPMRLWLWLADATVYLLLLVTVSGIYLWYALSVDRKIGLALLAMGAASFFGIVYAIVH